MVKDPAKRLGHMGADEILAHPWFGHLDRDALAMDQVESPYIPTKDINAAPQRAIGSFADAGSKVTTLHLRKDSCRPIACALVRHVLLEPRVNDYYVTMLDSATCHICVRTSQGMLETLLI